MHSPKTSSPSFKNLRYKHSQSPIELKEKMRKDYKHKVQNCRDMLLNRFRGSDVGKDLKKTLAEIYKSTFDFSQDHLLNDEESELLEEIKKELIQEELEWFYQEYEKAQMENIDWSSMQSEEQVICPVCEKYNFTLNQGLLSCQNCSIVIKTNKTLGEIKTHIFQSIEKHCAKCNNEVQFSVISEVDQSHIYLICDTCLDINLIV